MTWLRRQFTGWHPAATAAATCLLLAFTCGCQYYGASIMALSSAADPSAYDGPVHATAGLDPAQGLTRLRTTYDPADGPVVLADFEQNAILDGVWDQADHDAYRSMVKYAPTGGHCMVIVLGWRDGPAYQPLVDARADITAIAGLRVSPTFLVDFRPLVEAHPEWFTLADAKHPQTDAGLAAYADLIADGVAQCP